MSRKRTPRRTRCRGTTSHLVMNDLHIPLHDPRAISLAIAVGKAVGVHSVELLGDIADCYSIGRYLKLDKKLRRDYLDEEAQETRSFLAELRRQFGDIPMRYYEGNHEYRLRKYIAEKAPALKNLKGLDWGTLVGLPDFGIDWIPYWETRKLGDLTLMHGTACRNLSGYTAHKHMDLHQGSVIHGHTHRGATVHKSVNGSRWVGQENFCLCRLDPEYVNHPVDWQQGFSIVEVQGGLATIEPIPISPDYRCKWREHYFG